MKGHIPQEIIEEIKGRVNIVDAVSEYVTLKKAGRNFVGFCPFHQEKTPSFTVNPEKQIFYCFGCGEGGNAISFIMKINNMTFPEAVRHLAAKTGVHIPEREMSATEKRQATEKEKIDRINMMAAHFFSDALMSEGGGNARTYLATRGMDDTVAQKFFLGYAPDEWRSLKRFFDGKKVPLNLAEKAGLLISRDRGQPYDRFRGRLIFPIQDLNGHVIAFGGRALGSEEPKYLNSPESPVYTKGKTLYGLYQTRDDIRRLDSVIIVEGYFDLLALWSVGITNVVATLGTALTKNQVQLLRRFTRNIILIFDPDEAGRHAVERGLNLFLGEQMQARVVTLPAEYDPADYARAFGGDRFRESVSGAVSMVDYYIDHIIGGRETLEENIDSVMNSISFIEGIEDPIQRNLFIKRVSEKLGVDQALLKREVNRNARRKPSAPSREASPPRREKNRVDPAEVTLMYIMMEFQDTIDVVAEKGIVTHLATPEFRAMGERLITLRQRNEIIDPQGIIDELSRDAGKEILMQLLVQESPFSDEILGRVLDDTIRKIRNRWYKSRHKILKMELAEAQKQGDQKLLNRLLHEKERLLKEERGYS